MSGTSSVDWGLYTKVQLWSGKRTTLTIRDLESGSFHRVFSSA